MLLSGRCLRCPETPQMPLPSDASEAFAIALWVVRALALALAFGGAAADGAATAGDAAATAHDGAAAADGATAAAGDGPAAADDAGPCRCPSKCTMAPQPRMIFRRCRQQMKSHMGVAGAKSDIAP